MKAYQFDLVCPDCEGDLEHLGDDGDDEDHHRKRTARATCVACDVEWEVTVMMMRVRPSKRW